MAEVIGNDGTWTFDGELLRVVPGSGRGVHRLRRLLGEISVPLTAVAGIAYEPGGKKSGHLRLRLRQGADPLLQAAGWALTDAADPYRLKVDARRSASAEYLVDEMRNWLQVQEIGTAPVDRYLLPGPDVPIRASGSDGSVMFDGETIRLEWQWIAEAAKSQGGARELPLREVTGVELRSAVFVDDGYLRFRTKDRPDPPEPKRDPHTLMLWGLKKEWAAVVMLASAVVARLPHPNAPAIEAPSAPELTSGEDDHDTLLRRLRELGDLHKEGILTEEEFTTAKQALLRRL